MVGNNVASITSVFALFLISFQFHALYVLGVLSLILLLLGRDIAKQKILSFNSYHKLETTGIISIAQIKKQQE